MQAARQGAHPRGHPGVDVGLGGDGLAAGEGGGVEGMVRVQGQADIQVVGGLRVCFGACQHVEEVGRVLQVFSWSQGLQPRTDAVPGRHQGGEAGDEPHGLFRLLMPVGGYGLGVVHGQHGYRGLQHVHGGGLMGPVFHAVDDEPGGLALVLYLAAEVIQLGPAGQAAKEEQKGGLHVGGPVGQILHPITPVDQDPLFAVDEADGRVRHGDAPEAGVFDAHLFAHVDPPLAGPAILGRKIMILGGGGHPVYSS